MGLRVEIFWYFVIGGALFISCIATLEINATVEEGPNEPDQSRDDAIQLSLLAKKDFYDEWANWSSWSSCSVTCGRGVRHKLRRCLGKRCPGKSVSHELCTEQRCPLGTLDMRSGQCAEYNRMPYKNVVDQWQPVEQRASPCALHCKSIRFGYTVAFGPKVMDGTPCNNSSRHLCVDGKCLQVGCDDVIGSSKRLDDCGVCDGDGTTCGRPLFHWVETYKFSQCDQTCGPDSWRVSISVCMDARNNKIVTEKFCADKERPRPIIEKCPYTPCPADCGCDVGLRWLVGQWHECNVTCGGGYQLRDVYCAERHNNTKGAMENRKVPEKYCWNNKKPSEGRECANQQCPLWETGQWQPCSVTCGKGKQVRKVACRQERYTQLNRYACDPKHKPPTTQVCYTGLSCKQVEAAKMADYERYRYVAAAPFTQWDDSGAGMFSPGASSSQPHWVPGQWVDCSTSCGPGVRSREVECMVLQPISRTTLKLPDYECEGKPKPVEFQPCELRSCPQMNEAGKSAEDLLSSDLGVKYRWEYGEWTQCSASCLGGKQKTTLTCISVSDRQSVAWSYCNPKQRPVEITRTCNNQPCPPDWEKGAWSVCSHTCGGGLKTRQVRCIREIAREGNVPAGNVLILPDVQCDNPKPRDREPCGLADCPARWNIGEWNACSTSCGPGEQRRHIFCEQHTADGKLRRYNLGTQCRDLQKPPSVQLCNFGACPTPAPAMQSTLKNFEQVNSHRRLTLRVGGKATLYEGTSIKIKCPVRNFDRSQISWTKDGQLIPPDGQRVKISKYGALRIFKAKQTDAGLYACIAGKLQGNITLAFKPHKVSHIVPTNTEKQGGNRIDNLSPAALHKLPMQSEQKQTYLKPMEPMDFDDTEDEEDDLDQVAAAAVSRPKQPYRFQSKDGVFQADAADLGDATIQKLKHYLLTNRKMDIYDALNDVSKAGVLRLEWTIGQWSPCSHTCAEGSGPNGMQFRSIACKVDVKGFAAYVSEDICLEFKLAKPEETKECASNPCPVWISGNWTECEASRCIRFSSALQRRKVDCIFPNGTRAANDNMCNRKTRPLVKKPCFNSKCNAEWRASNWGPCTRTCGDGGVEMRMVRCVWHGTRKPAGNNCRGSDRPKILRPCRDQLPCPDSSQPGAPAPAPFKGAVCEDTTRYCDTVLTLQLCTTGDYARKCCLTCSYVTRSPNLIAGAEKLFGSN